VGCGPDLIEQGRTGELFPLDDIPALARAIEAVLAFDPARTREAIAARMAVYSPNRTARGIMEAAVVVGGLRQSTSGR
jgi:glycosyltransferase involved in cell wall biosynthesis